MAKKTFICTKCGRRFEKQRGLQVHSYLCGKKRPAPKQPGALKAASSEQAVLTIPCTLAGNAFHVDVTVTKQGTSIRPA
jgi:DNA-directed RNA polymerase subunit RPC12/RpoP